MIAELVAIQGISTSAR